MELLSGKDRRRALSQTPVNSFAAAVAIVPRTSSRTRAGVLVMLETIMCSGLVPLLCQTAGDHDVLWLAPVLCLTSSMALHYVRPCDRYRCLPLQL